MLGDLSLGGNLLLSYLWGVGLLDFTLPPGLGTNAGRVETWILSSCHQTLADCVCVSARSLSFHSFDSFFLNHL